MRFTVTVRKPGTRLQATVHAQWNPDTGAAAYSLTRTGRPFDTCHVADRQELLAGAADRAADIIDRNS